MTIKTKPTQLQWALLTIKYRFGSVFLATDCCACKKRISTGALHFLTPKNLSHGYCKSCLEEAKALLRKPTL